MREAWIQLECPDCTTQWENEVRELPKPREQFRCDHCGSERRTAEFTRTTRDLEVLREMTDSEAAR